MVFKNEQQFKLIGLGYLTPKRTSNGTKQNYYLSDTRSRNLLITFTLMSSF